ncbi:putative ribosome biogenesis GTPase RsgA [Planomonospora parontospora subsp. parontospora]|uniref:Small ribosomal subunit biogenesis GTPase RsgA n=2 Tax=Planomonospora parontospora TaxID=58119 RepID=A0AA37BNJ3_9ACTN|nr:putative ribosome biogenesis GTPase RsgA [Planomonospora parontospora]GII12721.1 putative ribosome biogenesis GTPase RsgA [Planomonospora parontospora subsp. parontospora]
MGADVGRRPLRKRQYDEDDVRVRPGKGSRPRTRLRPAHEDAVEGFVVAVDRGRYTCLVTAGPSAGEKRRRARDRASGAGDDGRLVVAMKARELGRKGIVVGDRVSLVGDVSGAPDTLARVVRVEPRASMLRRSADDTEDTDGIERPVVANADQLVIVTALADPPPRPRMIDRMLVAAFDADIEPLLCLTKSDLAPPEELVSLYAPLGVPYVVVSKGGTLDEVRERLRDRISVLVGHSGVGKSTLVNALVPGADRAVSHVNAVTGRGRHTSTSAVALALPDGGWIIDTPGVRSFGLAHVSVETVLAGFPDLVEGTVECPKGCNHLGEECALDGWVAAGRADPARLVSLRRLLAIREGAPDDDRRPDAP